MGCDIHTYTEVEEWSWSDGRPQEREWTGEWGSADVWGIDGRWRAQKLAEWDGKSQLTLEPYEVHVPNVAQVYTNRNYSFFAALADVRNYHGIPPQFPGRGVPDNASNIVKTLSKRLGPNAHSHSWATLAELKEMREWARRFITEYSGVIRQKQMEKMRDDGYTFEEVGVEDQTEDVLQAIVQGRPTLTDRIEGMTTYRVNKPPKGYSRAIFGESITPVQLVWDQPIENTMGRALDEMIQGLELRKRRVFYRDDEELDEHVRCVFWFDN